MLSPQRVSRGSWALETQLETARQEPGPSLFLGVSTGRAEASPPWENHLHGSEMKPGVRELPRPQLPHRLTAEGLPLPHSGGPPSTPQASLEGQQPSRLNWALFQSQMRKQIGALFHKNISKGELGNTFSKYQKMRTQVLYSLSHSHSERNKKDGTEKACGPLPCDQRKTFTALR